MRALSALASSGRSMVMVAMLSATSKRSVWYDIASDDIGWDDVGWDDMG